MIVELTEPEIRICTWVGQQRFAHARRRGRDPGLGPTATAIDAYNDIRGAQCEYAGSIMLNMYWRPTIGEIHSPDVGGFVEVRSGDDLSHRLIVKPSDANEAPFALIIRYDGEYHFRGWLFAEEAKTFPLLTQFGDAAHFINQRELRGFRELFDLCHERLLQKVIS